MTKRKGESPERESEEMREREKEILPSQNYNTKRHNYLPNHSLF